MNKQSALEKITESLREDPEILSIFLKGSMGRGEDDEFSDIDLYCLVEGEKDFLKRRRTHLKAYGSIVYYEELFIIAPQVITVYEDGLHVDLFTVTEKTLQTKDYFKVLHDPEGRMKKYEDSQHLTLTIEEFKEKFLDAPWFLFQYSKAAKRGNDLWAVEMLRHSIKGVVDTLLFRHAKERSVLGLKTAESSLPEAQKQQIRHLYEKLTPSRHKEAAKDVAAWLDAEKDWLFAQLKEDEQNRRFLEWMLKSISEK